MSKKFYVQDRRQFVGNCMLWWRQGRAGYTTKLDEAHVFDESELPISDRETDVPWEKDYIDGIATRTVDFQRADKTQAQHGEAIAS